MTSREKKIIDNCFLFKNTGLNFDKKSQVFKKGEIIYKPSGKRRLGIMVSGKSHALSEDCKTILNLFEKGDMFGVAGLFGEGDVFTYVIAQSDCEVIFFDEDEISKIIETNSFAAKNYISFLSGRIRFLNFKISLFSLQSCTARLAKYLVFSYDDENKRNVSFAKLALMLSVGRASLYRAMDTLEKDGVISRKNGEILIINREKLKDYYEV